jgi:hypothetical protein
MATKQVSIKKASRTDFTVSLNDGDSMRDPDIQLGAILRIADATELMAKNYTELQSNLEMYKRWYKEENEKNIRLCRKIYALRGHMTRLKNRLKNQSNATI